MKTAIVLTMISSFGVFDFTGFWHNVASMLGAAAMWANQRAHRAESEPVDELIYQLRHPIRWTMRHPVISIRRKIDRRRAS